MHYYEQPDITRVAKAQIVDQGVDWLTCTTKDDRVGFTWLELFRSVAESDKHLKAAQTDWQIMGYKGQCTDGIEWGWSENWGYILRLHGSASRQLWPQLKPSATNITRVDLQVTISLDREDTKVADRTYTIADSASTKRKKLTVTRIENNKGGNTVYIGSRNSSQYARLYDKGAELGQAPGHIWRYEVEVKKPLSFPLFSEIYSEFERDPTQATARQKMVGYVWNWFDARGVIPLFRPNQYDIIIDNSVRVETSTEKKLAWLHTQVRPSVLRLIEVGLGREVRQALGLTEVSFHTFDEDGNKLEIG